MGMKMTITILAHLQSHHLTHSFVLLVLSFNRKWISDVSDLILRGTESPSQDIPEKRGVKRKISETSNVITETLPLVEGEQVRDGC